MRPAILAVLLSAAAAAALPSHYDLRDEGRVSSVKYQQGGTCWTHGVMAAMESNLLTSGAWTAAGESGEPNLAEYHLDWWNGFNQHHNDDLDPPWGEGLEVHYGGDYRVASAYLALQEGAVRDVDGQSFDEPPPRWLPSYHYYVPREIIWLTRGENGERMDLIKQAIMEHGALGTCMAYDSGLLVNYVHYQPPGDPRLPNHAVTLIGWDDDLVTQAPEPGAWIVKNSWGEGWGLGGYFYIAYEDKYCAAEPQMGAVSFRDVEPKRFDLCYRHDTHGWRDQMEGCVEAFNAFTSTGVQRLKAVAFYAAADSVDYEVKVFGQFDGHALSDERASLSGWAEYTGYRVLDLPTPVTLGEGENFYLYLSLSMGGQPYDRSSEIPVLLGSDARVVVNSTAARGESWFRQSGVWTDLQDFDDFPWTGTGNFCIQGLADEYPTGLVEPPSGSRNLRAWPAPARESSALSFSLEAEAWLRLAVYDVGGRLVAELAEGRFPAGARTVAWNLSDRQGRPLPAGLYMARLENGGRTEIAKIVIVR